MAIVDKLLTQLYFWMKEQNTEEGDDSWETPVVRNSDQEAIGASFYLTSEDLRELGIDIELFDHLRYRITEQGKIEIMAPSDQ